jgi:hypothetical protein
VGLLVDGPPPRGFEALVTALERWCRPRAGRDQSPDAWLVSRAGLEPEDGRPCAVAPACGRIDASGIRWTTPFVRSRWRMMLGLPSLLLVEGEQDDPLEGKLASAAVVRGEDALMRFLALGVPCATDAASAQGVGARDRQEVLVGAPERLASLARELGADIERGTRLSRAGRLLVERKHDAGPAAREVAKELGLVRPGDGGQRLLTERLGELGTDPDVPIEGRALRALP